MADNFGTVTCASEDGPASSPALTSADDRRVNESRENKEPDFTKLHPALWVAIFSYLSQRERLILSLTCHALYDICMQSSVLWRSAIIHMGSGKIYEEVKLNTTDRSVLRALSHHTKTVTIKMNCIFYLIVEESSHYQLCKAAALWPLEHLELGFESRQSNCYSHMNRFVRDFLHTCITSSNARGLSSLKICAHHWTTNHGRNFVVDTLRNSSFTSSLTNLYLGMIMPCFEYTEELCFLDAIGRFENLQYFTVPYEIMSNGLLNTFPRHLKEIHIIINTWDGPKEVSNWPHVLTRFPDLIVGLEFVDDPPFNHLPRMIPFDIPVSSVKIRNRSDGHGFFQWKLLQILPQYFIHLQKLQCKYVLGLRSSGSISSLEEILITVASKCPKLDYLDFYGYISSHAVVTLAGMRRWRKLEFNAASINFGDSTDRSEGLQTLCVQVSSILGRDWKPQSRNESHTETPSTGIGLHFPTISPP